MTFQYKEYHAVDSLTGGKEYVCVDGVYTFKDGSTPPTKEQIAAEVKRLQDIADGNKWKDDRMAAYPDWRDLADAMYWNSKGDASKLTAYYAACEKVKSDNPKPT